MDKDYLLDLLVSVRERNMDVNTALEEICAMANNENTGKNTLPIQHVSFSEERSEVCRCINWHPSIKENQGKKAVCSYCKRPRQKNSYN